MGQQKLSIKTSQDTLRASEQITVDIFHEVNREITESGAIKLGLSLFFNEDELQLNSLDYPSPSFNSSLEATLEDTNNDDGSDETNKTTAIFFEPASLEFPYPEEKTKIITATFNVLESFDGSEISVKIPSTTAQTYNNVPPEVFESKTLNLELDFSTENQSLDTPITRFQNSGLPGTYLFAGPEESQGIRENFSKFIEEGQAFKVATEPEDDLIRLNRFQNSNIPGTYLYAGEEESQGIRENFPNFIEEGIAFYVYDGNANLGVDFYRFQNLDVPGTYIFVGGEERENILVNFPNFVEEGVAFEVVI